MKAPDKGMHCGLHIVERCVHPMDRCGSAIDRAHTKVSSHKALVYRMGRRRGRISKNDASKRADTVEENLLHVREEVCGPSVIMKNFIANIRLLPSSTNAIVLTPTLKKYFILELRLHIFCFSLPFLRELNT